MPAARPPSMRETKTPWRDAGFRERVSQPGIEGRMDRETVPISELAPPVEREWLPDRERRNPWFRWLIHLIMPILTSVFFHLLVLAVLALKTWELMTPAAPPEEFEASIRDIGGDLTGGFKWPSESDLEVAPPEIVSAPEPAQLNVKDVADQLAGARTDATADAGGFGIGDIGRSGVLGIGSGAGTGGGAGIGQGFGAGAGTGSASVWNLSASGNNFVYVVDFSGSIVVSVDELKRELKRSIGSLRPGQTFDVVLFYGDHGNRILTESFEPGLVKAEPEAKRRFFNWIEKKKPRGSTEPLAALKRALSLDPDAVFFFSDGLFDPNVVDVITKDNNGKVVINCLVFDENLLGDRSGLPKESRDGVKRMKSLADKNKGQTKIVTGKDLGTR